MFKFINTKKLTGTGLLAVLMTGTLFGNSNFSANANTDVGPTGSITPSTFTDTIGLSETISLDRTVRVDIPDIVETTTTTTTIPQKLDILFLADNTGSMGAEISNVQANANSLLTSLSSTYSDIQFGVARYYGDPDEYGDVGDTYSKSVRTGNTISYRQDRVLVRKTKYGGYTYYQYKIKTYKDGNKISEYARGSWRKRTTGTIHSWTEPEYTNVTLPKETYAYELQEPVNGGTKQDAIDAINDWFASGGGDTPEGNFFALQQAATSGASTDSGYATGYNTNWRADAKKIIVWFGDAKSHTDSIDQAEAIQALNDNDIAVVSIFASDVTNTDWIANYGLNSDGQASSVATQTGGQYSAAFSSDVASTMQSLIGAAAQETTTNTNTISPTIDLTFASTGSTTGLNIIYTCTDSLGCDGVGNGETRSFRMEVTGNTAGQYNFDTVVTGVTNATATNDITVNDNYAD